MFTQKKGFLSNVSHTYNCYDLIELRENIDIKIDVFLMRILTKRIF